MLRRMNDFTRAAVCLLLCLGLLLPCIALSEDTQKTRERFIFDRLTAQLQARGVQHPEAMVCGILGNIYYETGASPFNYDPATVGDYSGGTATSGGICGWHNSRWTALKKFCDTRGHNWDNLEDQCDFLVWELYESGDYNDTRKRLLAVDNDIHGAWYAAYMFCYWFEGPADRIRSAVTRGYKAEEFWREYANGAAVPVTSGDPKTSTLSVNVTLGPVENKVYGDYFTSCNLRGTVNSNYPITSIDCYVADAYGNKVSGYNRSGSRVTIDFAPKGWDDQRWDGRHFDIYWDGADANLPFSAIDYPGSYFYCIDATDVSGKTVAYRCLFHVIGCTVANYTFYSSESTVFSSGSTTVGSSITLPSLANQPGFLFAGWLSNGTTYAAGESCKLLSPATAFTPLWSVCPHRWDEGAVTPPTAETGGCTTYTCLDCGYTEQRDFTDPLPPSQIPGDLNGDYLLNEEDLHLLARHIAGIATLTDLSLADVNGDGNISAADLTALAGLVK